MPQNMSISHRKRKVFKEHRNSRPKMPCKKGVLRNFTKFTWKQLCQSLCFNKVADLSPATLFKERLWHRCFPVKFAKFLRTTFLTEHFQWLLLRVPNFVSVPDFVLSRTPQIPWQKHSSEHLFYKIAPSGCFQMSEIFLKKGKTEIIFHTSSELITLEIL